jgi:hypothetical protein
MKTTLETNSKFFVFILFLIQVCSTNINHKLQILSFGVQICLEELKILLENYLN